MSEHTENFNAAQLWLPVPSLIVWDMDGTLTSAKAGKLVAEEHESRARKVLELSERAYQLCKSFKNLVVPGLHLGDDMKKSIISPITKNRAGSDNALSFYSNNDIINVLVSHNSHDAIGSVFLRLHDLQPHLDATRFKETLNGKRKPHPDIMKDILQELEQKGKAIPPNATIWVVGDSRKDMMFGENIQEELGYNVECIAMGGNTGAARYLISTRMGQEAVAIINKPEDLFNMMMPHTLDPRWKNAKVEPCESSAPPSFDLDKI
tara:strand:+ start:63 stop:854 length:792 start_codon:yes stop_codon:yes gene_type:complete